MTINWTPELRELIARIIFVKVDGHTVPAPESPSIQEAVELIVAAVDGAVEADSKP